MCQRNILLPSSGSKSMPSKQASSKQREDGGCVFVNIRKYYSSYCCGNFSLAKRVLMSREFSSSEGSTLFKDHVFYS
jgi:hypothetical protein